MITAQKAILSREAAEMLTQFVSQLEIYTSNAINAKGILLLNVRDGAQKLELDHTELHVITDTLNEVIRQNTGTVSALAKLQSKMARALLNVLELHTKVFTVQPNTLITGKYVCLEGLEHGNRFFTPHVEGEDPSKLTNGQVAYRVLGFANEVSEAQALIGLRPRA